MATGARALRVAAHQLMAVFTLPLCESGGERRRMPKIVMLPLATTAALFRFRTKACFKCSLCQTQIQRALYHSDAGCLGCLGSRDAETPGTRQG